MLNGISPARSLSTGCETFKAQAAKTEVSIALPGGGVFAYSSSKSRSISIETTIASKQNAGCRRRWTHNRLNMKTCAIWSTSRFNTVMKPSMNGRSTAPIRFAL